ncbi:Ankyrin repeat protein [Phytophthora palmivora]|uniref:Ankyrin repeat protein n=1 Tax=Phytophthora palmivora TaxID=4796 RepID=A0A2P4YM97_9STRA|nr:Ankyrin repeat protein [Phytophthora palmivora]
MERHNLDAEAIAHAVTIASIEGKCGSLKLLVEDCQHGRINVVEVLIGKTSFEHIADMMRSAAKTNCIEMMELLLKVGLDHQPSDDQKRICLIDALRSAVLNSSISMASLLLEKGWNVDVGQLLYIVEDNDTEMAKLLAVKSSQVYLEDALVSCGCKEEC